MPNLQTLLGDSEIKVKERAEDGSRALKGRTEQRVKEQTCFVFVFFLRKKKVGNLRKHPRVTAVWDPFLPKPLPLGVTSSTDLQGACA